MNNVPETTHVKREDFRRHAADFLSLPDLTQKKWKGDYKEDNFYDATLESVILTYTALDEDLETRKQELIVEPSLEEDSKVRTIIAEKISEEKGVMVRKYLLWQIDRRFQVVTTREEKNGKQHVEKVQVIWNREG